PESPFQTLPVPVTANDLVVTLSYKFRIRDAASTCTIHWWFSVFNLPLLIVYATMSPSTSAPESSETLPLPVTNGNVAPSNRWSAVAPSLIAFTTGLTAVSSNQPRTMLLFIGAGTVVVGLYFVVPPSDDEKTRPVVSTFLRRLPDAFTAFSCILIVLGIGSAFPNEMALIPLFLFIAFTALALLFGMTLGMLTATTLHVAALISLMIFIVLVLVA
ncbi:hypothetical protein HD554DRAFT_1600655, partial [Boletus coccyginus]